MVNSKYIPILYSTLMVQRILSRDKTQTRRERGIPENTLELRYNQESGYWEAVVKTRYGKIIKNIRCPYGKSGDIHWVRETFSYSRKEKKFFYKADNTNLKRKWKPSIHMPKKACRIWLQVISIRAEKLHNISIADIKSEGIILKVGQTEKLPGLSDEINTLITNSAYSYTWNMLWIKINGIDSWEKNPWVWVIKFKKIRKPKNWIA